MTARALLDYYGRKPYETATEATERDNFIATNRNHSAILAEDWNGTKPAAPTLKAMPKKSDFRITADEVSERAEAMIAAKRDEAFAALEKAMNWAGIPIQKGKGAVHTPRPDVPHFKEAPVAAIQTGPNKWLLISMTNMPSERVEVMEDGKLSYHGIRKPKDGDDPMNTNFPMRGVERLPNGKFRRDPEFTDSGLAWKAGDIDAVSKAILKAAGKLPDPNRPRRTTESTGPSMAAQDRATMQAMRERQQAQSRERRQSFGQGMSL